MDNYKDYYTGFEGEPEYLVFTYNKAGEKSLLYIWRGYFESILDTLKPEPEGWTGLLLHHHLDTGWNDTSPAPWEIPDKELALHQFEAARKKLNSEPPKDQFRCEEMKPVCDDIINLLKSAITDDKPVYIVLDPPNFLTAWPEGWPVQ